MGKDEQNAISHGEGNGRNQSFELIKFIAACFVVFTHVKFPGTLGEYMNFIRGVPFFLLITGYFTFQTEPEKIKKRMIHILKLILVSSGIYLCWGCFEAFYTGQGVWVYIRKLLSVRKMAQWILLDKNPLSLPLWYLSALLTCYLIIWFVLKFQEEKRIYKPFYIFAGITLIGNYILSFYLVAGGIEVERIAYRNAVFTVFPVICIGIALHEYQERLIRCFDLNVTKLIVVTAVGTALGWLQWFGIGASHMPIGSLAACIAITMMAVMHPAICTVGSCKERIIFILGKSSLIIYIIHPLINKALTLFMKTYFKSVTKMKVWKYTKPLTVLGIAIVLGIIYACIKNKSSQKQSV